MADNKDFPEISDFVARRMDDKNLFKDAVKEAVSEWLDRQFLLFGKWSAIGIAAAAFALFVKLLISENIIPR